MARIEPPIARANCVSARARRPIFLPFLVLFSLISILWSLATPIFSSPDETAHATKAVAQLRGQFVGYEREGVRFPVIDLPESYRYSDGIICYVRIPETPANCGVDLGSEQGTDWFGNWVLSYNPIYYYIVGWPTLFLDGTVGVFAMRILSALLSAALLAYACTVAYAQRASRWMSLGVVFFASPMVAFLAGSVNPQGMEITAGVLSWVACIRLFESYRDGTPGMRWPLWAALLTGSFFLVQARALGPLWWMIIAAFVIVSVGLRVVRLVLRDRNAWPWMAAILISAFFSLWWTLKAGTLNGQADVGDAALVGGGPLAGFWAMLRGTPSYIQQAVGFFGWLDTPVPGLVLSLYLAAAFMVVAFALISTGRRGGLINTAAVLVAVLVPPLVQAAAVSRTGLIWQGRYSLFLYLGVVIVAVWTVGRFGDRRLQFLSGRMTLVVGSVLALYHFVVFVITLRRYVIGTARPITEMIHNPLWQPPLTWPMLVGLLGVTLVLFTWFAVHLARSYDAGAPLARSDRVAGTTVRML